MHSLMYESVEGTVADSNALQNMEPDKCEKWEWVDEKLIREWARTGERVMFLPIINYYEQSRR